MSKYVVKATARTIKNYTKGYSDIQAKVRSATSNDPWGPSGTLMNEIAKATYNHNEFIEIMEMIDKRLNDHGKNWRHVFKALTLLDYCLHGGSEQVVSYAKKNLYVVKTLTEFQYIDEEGKDQGANVRQKAKEITNLLQDEERLKQERRNRDDMRRRMGGRSDYVNDQISDRSIEPGYLDDESEMQRAIEEIEKALRLSKEEEEKRLARLAEQNEKPLIDTSGFGNNPFPQQQTDFFGQPINSQFGNNQFSQYSSTSNFGTTTSYGTNGTTTPYGTNGISSFNMSTSNFSSPNLATSTFESFSSSNKQPNFDSLIQSQEITKKPQDEKHSKLASLIASGGDGMDTFGNVGNRRVPAGSGFANALSVPSPRRSNSTGDISINQANPFLNTGGSGGGDGGGGYNTFSHPTTTTRSTDLFFGSTGNNTFNQEANQARINESGFGTPPSKNPFQIQTPNTNTHNVNKPVSLNDLARLNQQNSPFHQNTGGFGNW
ncbi:21946_t:CDS:10 [Rhizophagus irregularis]|nr:21946_t:CDS:10 [Rhizophagus irregularis]